MARVTGCWHESTTLVKPGMPSATRLWVAAMGRNCGAAQQCQAWHTDGCWGETAALHEERQFMSCASD